MTIEEIRARLAEISASLEDVKPGAEGYSQEQLTQIDELQAEFEQLSAQLEAEEKVQAMKAKLNSTAGRKTSAQAPASSGTEARIHVGEDRSRRYGGYESAGAWLMAVKKAGQTGKAEDRLEKFHAQMKESVGEDGGFLVPEEISSAILKKMGGDDSLMSRTNTIQVSSNNLTINVDETQPWNGGIQAYWTEEGGEITKSKPNFKQAQFRLHKLAALVKATDELLDDATALESYILAAAPMAFVHQVNTAILTGNGVGKPVGIINSPFTITVGAESGQANDTIVARNVIKMYTRMFPQSRQSAVWYINPEVEEHLRTMKDDNGNFIYLAPGSQMNQTPYATLLGRPVIPLMGGMPAIGDVGDIIFADLSYYYMIRKAAGIKSATSIHLHFDREITSFRFSMRVDGKCPFQAPVTTEHGSYQMSAFVNLAAR